MAAASSSEDAALPAESDATVENGRVNFRRALLRPFGTVWDAREVSETPCTGVRFRCADSPVVCAQQHRPL